MLCPDVPAAARAAPGGTGRRAHRPAGRTARRPGPARVVRRVHGVPARAAIHALKYDGERRLAAPLGALLAERWRKAGWAPISSCRCPSTPRGDESAASIRPNCWRECSARAEPAGGQRAGASRRDRGAALTRAASRALQRRRRVRASRRSAGAVRGRWVLIDDVSDDGRDAGRLRGRAARGRGTGRVGLTVARAMTDVPARLARGLESPQEAAHANHRQRQEPRCRGRRPCLRRTQDGTPRAHPG